MTPSPSEETSKRRLTAQYVQVVVSAVNSSKSASLSYDAMWLPALAAYLALAMLVLVWVVLTAPTLTTHLFTPLALLAVALSVVLGIAVELLARAGHPHASFGALGSLPFALTGLVAILLYPAIDPGAGLTVADAAVQTLPLNLMTVMAALITPIVIVYFAVRYNVFSGTIHPEESY